MLCVSTIKPVKRAQTVAFRAHGMFLPQYPQPKPMLSKFLPIGAHPLQGEQSAIGLRFELCNKKGALGQSSNKGHAKVAQCK